MLWSAEGRTARSHGSISLQTAVEGVFSETGVPRLPLLGNRVCVCLPSCIEGGPGGVLEVEHNPALCYASGRMLDTPTPVVNPYGPSGFDVRKILRFAYELPYR